MEKSTAIVLTNGLLDTPNAKTCHGLLRGTDRFEILKPKKDALIDRGLSAVIEYETKPS